MGGKLENTKDTFDFQLSKDSKLEDYDAEIKYLSKFINAMVKKKFCFQDVWEKVQKRNKLINEREIKFKTIRK